MTAIYRTAAAGLENTAIYSILEPTRPRARKHRYLLQPLGSKTPLFTAAAGFENTAIYRLLGAGSTLVYVYMVLSGLGLALLILWKKPITDEKKYVWRVSHSSFRLPIRWKLRSFYLDDLFGRCVAGD
jgi:hypothetical protein